MLSHVLSRLYKPYISTCTVSTISNNLSLPRSEYLWRADGTTSLTNWLVQSENEDELARGSALVLTSVCHKYSACPLLLIYIYKCLSFYIINPPEFPYTSTIPSNPLPLYIQFHIPFPINTIHKSQFRLANLPYTSTGKFM